MPRSSFNPRAGLSKGAVLAATEALAVGAVERAIAGLARPAAVGAFRERLSAQIAQGSVMFLLSMAYEYAANGIWPEDVPEGREHPWLHLADDALWTLLDLDAASHGMEFIARGTSSDASAYERLFILVDRRQHELLAHLRQLLRLRICVDRMHLAGHQSVLHRIAYNDETLLSFDLLASVTGLSVGSVRNLASGDNPVLRTEKVGKTAEIHADDAAKWLLSRGEFHLTKLVEFDEWFDRVTESGRFESYF